MGTVKRVQGSAMQPMKQMIADCAKLEAKVGYFPSAKYPDGTPIAYIAAIMENGAPSQSIPARPTMRPTIDAHRTEWKEFFGRGMASVANGRRDTRDVLDAVSGLAAGQVFKTIAALTSPPLSKLTILARKFKKNGGTITGGKVIGELAAKLKENPEMDLSGVSARPLNDSGAMMAHITNIVENK